MRALLKFIGYLVVAVLGLALLLSVAVYFLFDPNELKADIEDGVRDVTGRDFSIEGDLAISLFPWTAIEVGRTRLGNAEGFGEEPMVVFDSARLSIKVLPLIFGDELAIGTASLENLQVNLGVDANGRTNWDDLVERRDFAAEQAEEIAAESEDQASVSISKELELNVANVSVVDAAFSYRDDQAGAAYSLERVNLKTGSIREAEPVPVDAGFAFALEPQGISGEMEMSVVATIDMDSGTIELAKLELETRVEGATEAPATIRFGAPLLAANTEAQTVAPGSISLSVFDLDLVADVEPFSYAGDIQPKAVLSIAAFSPRSLLTTLGAEIPATADPAALELLRLDANAAVTADAIALENIELVVDNTTLKGRLSLPRSPGGSYELELAGDTIDLNRYMAPADTTESEIETEEAPPAEIPSELLRSINARGNLTFGEALMGPILFEDSELVLNLRDGRMRLNPFTSKLFDGQYQGDIRLDVSGNTPVLSVNERLQDVSLAALGQAMLDSENLTGLINGVFVLNGTGNDMAEIQQTLAGNVSFELKDGTLEGRDVWYELRRARAVIRREDPPQQVLPARTKFSDVSATGTVSNGVLSNDDFRADLPFMQLTGSGTVDLVAETLDYALRGRVFAKPELMGDDVTQAEIEDFTKAELPIRISGSLSDPKFGLDFEEVVKERVEEEVRDRLIDLLGGDESAPEGEEEAQEEQDVEDVLKDRLRDLLKKD